MKNFHYKSKVLFWSGLSMLILAGVIWIVSGGAKAVLADIQSGRAGNDSNGACSAPGCYSEEWTATEIFGLYRLVGGDTGQLEDNEWVSTVGTRTSTADILVGSSDNQKQAVTYTNDIYNYEGAKTFASKAVLESRNGLQVTKWQINGHVH